MIRMRQVVDALYHVQADSNAVDHRLYRLLVDPPGSPEAWEFELDQLDMLLWSLVERCWEAKPRLKALARNA
jgi:hypothetical protein